MELNTALKRNLDYTVVTDAATKQNRTIPHLSKSQTHQSMKQASKQLVHQRHLRAGADMQLRARTWPASRRCPMQSTRRTSSRAPTTGTSIDLKAPSRCSMPPPATAGRSGLRGRQEAPERFIRQFSCQIHSAHASSDMDTVAGGLPTYHFSCRQ